MAGYHSYFDEGFELTFMNFAFFGLDFGLYAYDAFYYNWDICLWQLGYGKHYEWAERFRNKGAMHNSEDEHDEHDEVFEFKSEERAEVHLNEWKVTTAQDNEPK